MTSAIDRAFEALALGNPTQQPQDNQNQNENPSHDDFYVREGILKENEDYETLYLNEDEIEKYMQQYIVDNPGTEVETRYINQAPVSVPQNIEVRWLRPSTPDIPPIIIQEVNVVEKEELPAIKLIQRPANYGVEEVVEPIVIREKPTPFSIPEPKTIYLPTIIKSEVREAQGDLMKDIKIEHVRSDSQSMYDSRLVYDDQVFDNKKQSQQYAAYEQQQVNYEEEESYGEDEDDVKYNNTYSFNNKAKNRSIREEEEIQLYEEKLMQTLYEEYLLKLERERLERKLSQSGIFEERIHQRERERSLSQERSMSQSQRMSMSQSNRYTQNNRSQQRFSTSHSQARVNEERLVQAEEIRMQQIRDQEFRLQQERLRDNERERSSRLSRIRLVSEQRQVEDKNRKLREIQIEKNERTRTTSFKQDDINRSYSYSNSIVNKVTDETELDRWNKLVSGIPSSAAPHNHVETEQTLSSIASFDPMQQIIEALNNKTSSNVDYHSVKSPTGTYEHYAKTEEQAYEKYALN